MPIYARRLKNIATVIASIVNSHIADQKFRIHLEFNSRAIVETKLRFVYVRLINCMKETFKKQTFLFFSYTLSFQSSAETDLKLIKASFKKLYYLYECPN